MRGVNKDAASRSRAVLLASVAVTAAAGVQATAAHAQTMVSYTGAEQTVDITTTGTYVLTLAGARGGNGANGTPALTGGAGAVIVGDYTFNAGDVLDIYVGGQGQSDTTGYGAGGGGGGTFVYDATTSTLIAVAAGGGGGGGLRGGASGGQITTSGAYGAGSGAGPGGSNGDGGTANPNDHGGGGGGYLTAGQNSSSATGGAAFPSLAGGTNPYDGVGGGFGGGGAATEEGGGGGGYSGGGGGSGYYHYGGGGGGSYENTNFALVSATAGSNGGVTPVVGNAGNGYFSYDLIPPTPITSSQVYYTSWVPAGSTVELQGGVLSLDQNNLNFANNITLDNSGTSQIDNGGNWVTFSGVLSDATTGGSLIIENSGVGGAVTFTGVNTYTGLTTIYPGATLALVGNGSIASSSDPVVDGTFDISGVGGGGTSVASLSGYGSVVLGSNTLTLTAATDTFTGVISGVGGGLTVAAGTETLTGANTFSGATTIAQGATLALSGAGSIDQSSGVTANGTLDISAANAGASIVSLAGGSNGSVVLGSQTLTLTAAADTFAGVISGVGGALTVSGGTETLSGVNTYTGATTIAQGATLALSGSGSIALSSGVAANGALDISATTAGASIVSLSGGSNGSVALGAQTLTLTNASGTFAGSMSGAGSISITGGTETFSGTLSNGSASAAAVVLAGSQSGLVNSGTIGGGGVATAGVAASIVNTSTGVISGPISFGQSGAATLDNSGLISNGVGGQTTGAITILNRASGVINTNGVYVLAPEVTIINAGYVTGNASALGANAGWANGVSTVINAAGGQLVAGTSTAYGGHYDNALQVWGVSSTFSNFGTALGGSDEGYVGSAINLANTGVATVNLYAGSTTGSVVAMWGATTINLYTGTGTSFTGLTYDLTTGTIVSGAQSDATHILLQAAGTNAAAVFGYLDLGAEADGVINLRGQGDGTAANGAASTLDLSQVANLSFLYKLDSGTWTLNGASTSPTATIYAGDGTPSGVLNFAGSGLTGDIYVNGAKVVAQASGAFGTGTIHAIDPVIEYAASGTYANNISLETTSASDPTHLTVDTGVTATLSGAISNGSGTGVLANQSVVFDGPGVAVLTGANTYTGTTTVSAGATVTLSGSGSIAASSSVSVDGTLDISQAGGGGASIKSLTDSGNGTGVVTLGSNTLTLTAASGTFTGAISGSGGLTISGGTETLSGTNGYTGATSIANGATLALSGVLGPTSIYSSSRVSVDGTFDISGATAPGMPGVGVSIMSLSDGGNGTGLVLLGNNPLVLINASGVFTGVLSSPGGTGGLDVMGGTETLTGVNTFTGQARAETGAELILSGQGSVSNAALVYVDGTFDVSGVTGGTVRIAGVTDGGAGTGVVDLGSNTLVITGAAGLQFSGAIKGSGGVEFAAGEEVLSGVSTYTGATQIDAGAVLAVTGAESIAKSSSVNVDGYFNIAYASGSVAITSLGDSGNGTGSVYLGANTLVLTDASGTFTGVITNGGTGAGGLIVQSGSETLTGVNTFVGQTMIESAGKLVLSGGGSIASSPVVDVEGTFDISAASGPVDVTGLISTLPSAGLVDLGANTLILTDPAHTGYAGAITGSGGLEVASGLEGLLGASTYTGATQVDAGATLLIAGSGSISKSASVNVDGLFDIAAATGDVSIVSLADSGSGVGSVVLGANTLDLTDASGTFTGVISNGGSSSGGLHVMGGTETLTGTNTYAGLTTIDSGATLALGNGGTTGSVAGDIVDNGLVQFNYSAPVTVANLFSGSGSVEFVAGSVVLTGGGAVGGTVTIDNGVTLQWGNGAVASLVGGSGALVDNGALIVDPGKNVLSGAFAISGTGSLTVQSGAFETSGVSTYTGATTIAAIGELALIGAGSIAKSSGVEVEGTFDISGTAAGASIQALWGGGAVTLGGQPLTLAIGAGNVATFSGVIQDAERAGAWLSRAGPRS